jgi:hypothetical protein
MARLYEIAPKLTAPEGLGVALEEALSRPVSPQMRELAERMVAHRGAASATSAATIGLLIGLAPSRPQAAEAPRTGQID